jgi:hypothetical protein
MLNFRLRALLVDAGFGKVGAEIAMRGPLGWATGTDLAGCIGSAMCCRARWARTRMLGTVPSMLFGRLDAAWKRYRSGQGAGAAAAKLLPSGLRNPARAAVEATQGLGTQKGGWSRRRRRSGEAGARVPAARAGAGV